MNEKFCIPSSYSGMVDQWRADAGPDYYTPYLVGMDDFTMSGVFDSMIAGWTSYTVKFTVSVPPGGMALRRVDAASSVA